MSVVNKVRIYDLAKELKQDTKRIMEELRREGADVSVPSNSVSKELAEKIRNRYFPKKETAPVRTIKVIKKDKTVEDNPTANEIPVKAEIPIIETKPLVKEEKREEKSYYCHRSSHRQKRRSSTKTSSSRFSEKACC